MEVPHLKKQEFLTKVDDYEKNAKEWCFLGSRPMLIDFYAKWCGPCKMLAPIVEQLYEDYMGRIDFYKIDIDQEKDLSSIFGIQSIPTLLFIPLKGSPYISRGAMNRVDLKKELEKLL
ncbi:MAG: thioredoxin [Bacteroidetes bacterium]|nr:thioredoxin [Bacteroidota bacterium]